MARRGILAKCAAAVGPGGRRAAAGARAAHLVPRATREAAALCDARPRRQSFCAG